MFMTNAHDAYTELVSSFFHLQLAQLDLHADLLSLTNVFISFSHTPDIGARCPLSPSNVQTEDMDTNSS
jgi:hypothetical protein